SLQIDAAVPISISQLRCSEPGCPPVETAIAVLSEPKQTLKIHKALAEVTATDIASASHCLNSDRDSTNSDRNP
ncbi:MAG: hypothetical protein AAFY11_09345, partial [Cyanobacteria bacterium J06641_5]